MNPRFFAAKLQQQADQSLTHIQQATNALPNLLRTVAIRSLQITGENKARQIPGTQTPVDTPITPAPRVVESGKQFDQYLEQFGGRAEDLNLLIARIPRTYTEAQLRGALLWVVDGKEYKLLGLVRTVSGYTAMVARAR